jgi:hypothetical protein
VSDELRDQEDRPVGDAAPAGGDVPADDAPPAGEAPPTGEAVPAGEAPPADPAGPVARPGAGRRLLAAVVTLPWFLAYGITGAWAVTRGAQAYSEGLKDFDVGYTRFVTPVSVMYVGALLLAASAVLLACAMLLLFDRRSGTVWLPVLLVAGGLTAGSIWAAVRGDLTPLLWVLFFFGLAFVTVVALVRVVQVTRAGQRATIVRP